MTKQSSKPEFSLLVPRGQVATSAAKGLSPKDRAKTARNLLLEFDHAHIVLGLVVVKIHTRVFQEAEEGSLIFAQAIEQVAGGTLLGSSLCFWGSGRPRTGQIPLVKEVEKLSFPIGDLQWVKPVFSLFTSVLGGCFHVQKQAFQVGGPWAGVFFHQEEQFSQHMHVTVGKSLVDLDSNFLPLDREDLYER